MNDDILKDWNTNRLPSKVIAHKYGIRVDEVFKVVKAFPRRFMHDAEIVSLYREGLGINEIREKLGCSRPTVYAALKRAGVERRPKIPRKPWKMRALIAEAQLKEREKELENLRKDYTDALRALADAERMLDPAN